MAGSYSTSVFIVIPVEDVVAAVFNTPVATIDSQNLVGIGLIWRLTGDAINDFTRDFPDFFLDSLTFDHEDLSKAGEIEIIIEFRRGPDLSDLDSAMAGIRAGGRRFAEIFKAETDVFEESRLVAFDGEVIMGLPNLDQIASQCTLGQKCISGDDLSCDVDRCKQRDGDLDFIRLFDGIIPGYGQDPDFFWVWQI